MKAGIILICGLAGGICLLTSMGHAGETAAEATPSSAGTLVPSSVATVPATNEAAPGVAVSGTPRLVRQLTKTEVFFSDLNKSYFIPSNDSHNEVMGQFLKAIKAKKPISFQAHPVSREILKMNEVKSEGAKPGTEAGPVVNQQ